MRRAAMMGGGVIADESHPRWVEAVQGPEGAVGVPPLGGERFEAGDFPRVDRCRAGVVPGVLARPWGVVR